MRAAKRHHGAEAKAVGCPAIDGIIKEANEVAGEDQAAWKIGRLGHGPLVR